ncbi:MAG TPA: ABC transporter permease subunit [Thermoplasmata archaeon]|nr:ABC transporter permease subunit [Thermoplasmata archaeon]
MLWTGGLMLAAYLGVAIAALLEFRHSLARLSTNVYWVAGDPPIGPSWAHPFGIMPGIGTDLFRAIWQATPWDLAIVASILTIDVVLGLFLGSIAGLYEGGAIDAAVTFVGDSIGAIPPYLFLLVVFEGLTVAYPHSVGLPVFVLLFGVILWPTMARAVRERARIVSHETFVESARASGAGPRRLLLRHIVPNSIGPTLAQIPIDVAPIFFVLSVFPWFYSCQVNPGKYEGFLIPILPPGSPLPSTLFPEWGYLLGFGTCAGVSTIGGPTYWWLFVFPLMAILGLGVAIAFVCDGLERWMGFHR